MIHLPSIGENQCNNDDNQDADECNKHKSRPGRTVSQTSTNTIEGGRVAHFQLAILGRVQRLGNQVIQHLNLEILDHNVREGLLVRGRRTRPSRRRGLNLFRCCHGQKFIIH